MNSEKTSPSKSRSGFSLVEVTLALGIVGMAILSLVGILGATFQQADEIMQTNRALSAATRLIGAFDNPRSIVSLSGGNAFIAPIKTTPAQPLTAYLTANPTLKLSNFDLAYELLSNARGMTTTEHKVVWFYVYDRKLSMGDDEFTQDSSGDRTYKIYSNPTVTEVAIANDPKSGTTFNLTPNVANQLNIVGTPMRVRVTLSRLLVGQRCEIDGTTFEPKITTWTWPANNYLDFLPSSGPPSSKFYALAYLPVVAEFFPHDWRDVGTFSDPKNTDYKEETPVLVQTIIISR